MPNVVRHGPSISSGVGSRCPFRCCPVVRHIDFVRVRVHVHFHVYGPVSVRPVVGAEARAGAARCRYAAERTGGCRSWRSFRCATPRWAAVRAEAFRSCRGGRAPSGGCVDGGDVRAGERCRTRANGT
ncbi:hypothetical protein GCM10010504_47470 [Streptomyces griseus]|nr:hypothetical protein GCM10010504_47470 [Streptomyces griseus]